MNLLHFLEILIINIWIMFSLKTGMINKLISAKFNMLIYTGSIFIFIMLTLIIILKIKNKFDFTLKFDATFFIICLLILGLFSDKKIQSKNLINEKYKGSIVFYNQDIGSENLQFRPKPQIPKKDVKKNNTPLQEPKVIQDKNNEQNKLTQNMSMEGIQNKKKERLTQNITADKVKNNTKEYSTIYDEESEVYQKKDIGQIYYELKNFKSNKEIAEYSYKVEVIGQIYDQEEKPEQYEQDEDNIIDLKENEFIIVRFLMICCVADMIPLGLIIENNQKIKTTDYEQWVCVKGKIRFLKDERLGVYYGYIHDDSIEKIEPPEVEYLNPIDYLKLRK